MGLIIEYKIIAFLSGIIAIMVGYIQEINWFWFMIGTTGFISISLQGFDHFTHKRKIKKMLQGEESFKDNVSILLAEIDNFQLERERPPLQQAGDIYGTYRKETSVLFSKKFAKRIIGIRSELQKAEASSKELNELSNFNDIKTIKKCLGDIENKLS